MDSSKQKTTIRIIEYFGKVVVSGILAVFLLSAFCLVYNHTGLHIKSESGATDYH